MGHFLSIVGLIVSLAGLSCTAISTFPEIWSQSEAKQWLFHSAGWFLAFLFGCSSSVHLSIIKRRHSNSIDTKDEAIRTLEKQNKDIGELHKESRTKVMELKKENSTIVRTLEYLMDRVSPETAIKKQTEREGSLDD